MIYYPRTKFVLYSVIITDNTSSKTNKNEYKDSMNINTNKKIWLQEILRIVQGMDV